MIPDPILDQHLRSAERLMAGAIRPGTRANHMAALRTFIGFSVFHNLDFASPDVPHICAFINYLVSHYSNPGTLANYVSSLTSVLRRLHVNVTPFTSIEVNDLMTSIKINMRHVPNKRPPVTMEMLPILVYSIMGDPQGPTVAFAIIIMFVTFLRQSNLAPRNKSSYDYTRHLTRADVYHTPEAVIFNIKWSKTQQGATVTSVAAPAIHGRLHCPVAAYQRMLSHAPTLSHNQPLISFPDGSPLPISYIDKAWDNALQGMGIPPRTYTLHSLRRGGATEVFTAGAASVQEIQQHGQWKSDAVYQYLPNDPRSTPVFRHFRDSNRS